MGLTSLFTDIASEMVLSLLGVFVVDATSAGGLGASAALLSLMEGLQEFVLNVFRVFSGFLTDLFSRRKPLMIIGYGISAFTKPLFGLATSFTQALITRLADRVGKGVRTSPRDALITESVPEGQRSRAFGFHRSLDQSGAVIGPILAGLLVPFVGYRGVFLFSVIPGIIAISILIGLVRDTTSIRKRRITFQDLRSILNFELVSFLVVIGVFTLGAYSVLFVQLKSSLMGLDPRTVAFAYAMLNLATVIVAVPMGTLADRIGNPIVLMFAYVFFFVTNIGNVVINTGLAFAFILASGYGLFLGTSDTVQRALIPGIVPSESKGTGYALYYLVLAITSFVGNITFGLLWNYVSVSTAYGFSLATSAAGIIGLAFLIVEHRTADDAESGTVTGQ